ncbi:MAG: motility associated factor glycosyltransferase family protein [Alteromonadaceae bacterium]|nr:motility associated factor glycosyltransferase family protein [Alteromonadaceae bacterium]
MLKDIRMHLEADEGKQADLEQQLSKSIIANHRRNALAFARHIPSIQHEAQNVTSESIAIFANKLGQHNIVDYGMGRTVYGLDPQAEISRQVEEFTRHAPYISLQANKEADDFNGDKVNELKSLPVYQQHMAYQTLPESVDVLVVFGLGLGFHIEKLVQQCRIKHLIIYEPEKQFFQCSVLAMDWQNLLQTMEDKGTAVYLQLEKDGRDLIENVQELASNVAIDGFYFLKHYNHDIFDVVDLGLKQYSWQHLLREGFNFASRKNPNLYLPVWSESIDLERSQSVSKDDPIFIKNLAAFKKYFPDIYGEFKDYQPQEWIPVRLPNDEINLVQKVSLQAFNGESPQHDAAVSFEYFDKYPQKDGLVLGYKGAKLKKYQHYQFVAKTEELLEEVSEDIGQLPETVKSLIMFGIGTGYPVETLCNQKKVEKLFLCEPNRDFFYASLFAIDWETILVNADEQEHRIYINIGDDGSHLFRDLLAQFYSIGPYILASTYFYQSYYNASLNQALAQLREQLQIVISIGEYYDHARFGIAHTTETISRGYPLLLAHPAKKLTHQQKEVPVFIVGNGPSLDNSIESIKEWQGQAIVVSCGTALMPLYKNGIVPDFHAEIEQNRSTFDWICRIGDFDYLKKINLISCNGIHPDTCDLFKNVYIAFKSGESSTVSALNILERKDYEELEFAFPTVSNFAVNIFSKIGFNQLYLMGVDLGFYNRDKHHSVHSGYYKKNGKEVYDYKKNNNTSIVVPGNFRKTVFTKHEFKVSKEILEQTLASRKLDCFNTSDGAKIQNTSPLTVDNILLTNSAADKEDALTALTQAAFCAYPEAQHYREAFEARYSPKNLEFELAGIIKLVEQPIETVADAEHLIDRQKDMLFASYSHSKSLLFFLLYGTLNYSNSVLSKIVNSRSDAWLAQTERFIDEWLHFLKSVKTTALDNLFSFDFCSSFADKREHVFINNYVSTEQVAVKTDTSLEPLLLGRLKHLAFSPEQFTDWSATSLDGVRQLSGILFLGRNSKSILEEVGDDIASGKFKKLLICGFDPSEIEHLDCKDTIVSYVLLGDFLSSNEDYEALASGEKPLIVAHHLSYVLYKCFMSCEYYRLFIPKANFYGENMVAQQKYVDNIIDCIVETDGFVEFSTYVAMNKRPGINKEDFHDAAGNLGMFFSGIPTANELIVPLSDNALRDELAFHAKGKWHLVD